MARISAYAMVYSDDPMGLKEIVSEMLETGWQPWGSPFAAVSSVPKKKEQAVLYQAMVLYEKRGEA